MPNFFKDNDDILFHIKNLDLDRIIQLKEDNFSEKGKYAYAPENIEDAKDSYERILDIVGDIAGNIVEPNAAEVDEQGTRFENGEVTYAEGTQKSLKASRQAELIGFTLPRKYGGLNCPTSIYIMAIEIMSRADAAFMNIFGLQSDIANTIYKYADDETKDKYIARLCTEDITAAMTLTEPDAGSDLQAVMMKAHQDENGNWFLNGVKRFITNGNAEIHLVLARSEEGTTDGRGLSMFVYERDEHMKIRRIENKLGIHGSPTCELQFNNAPAILVGRKRMGLIKYVMSLMNEARVGVSAQALGIAEAAYREALKYANERVQFKKKIIEFTPVAEMLVNMKVKIETARALLYETNRIVDIKEGLEEHVEHHPEKKQELRQEIKRYEALAAMFTPICKAYATEIGNQVAYDGLQIHGGTGFMKEFNAERHYRDVRITNIYEGTTQLQVVAAIGGVVKGIAQNIIEEYENNFDFTTVDYYHKKVKKMFSNFEKAVQYIKDKADLDYQNYHAQRLVEMATNVIISYLLMREAVKSERKKDILKFFLEFAMPETKMKYEVITDNTDSLLQNKDYILEGKN